jgi:hypothetical protein
VDNGSEQLIAHLLICDSLAEEIAGGFILSGKSRGFTCMTNIRLSAVSSEDYQGFCQQNNLNKEAIANHLANSLKNLQQRDQWQVLNFFPEDKADD